MLIGDIVIHQSICLTLNIKDIGNLQAIGKTLYGGLL